jgi:hypothetical protein
VAALPADNISNLFVADDGNEIVTECLADNKMEADLTREAAAVADRLRQMGNYRQAARHFYYQWSVAIAPDAIFAGTGSRPTSWARRPLTSTPARRTWWRRSSRRGAAAPVASHGRAGRAQADLQPALRPPGHAPRLTAPRDRWPREPGAHRCPGSCPAACACCGMRWLGRPRAMRVIAKSCILIT